MNVFRYKLLRPGTGPCTGFVQALDYTGTVQFMLRISAEYSHREGTRATAEEVKSNSAKSGTASVTASVGDLRIIRTGRPARGGQAQVSVENTFALSCSTNCTTRKNSGAMLSVNEPI